MRPIGTISMTQNQPHMVWWMQTKPLGKLRRMTSSMPSVIFDNAIAQAILSMSDTPRGPGLLFHFPILSGKRGQKIALNLRVRNL